MPKATVKPKVMPHDAGAPKPLLTSALNSATSYLLASGRYALLGFRSFDQFANRP